VTSAPTLIDANADSETDVVAENCFHCGLPLANNSRYERVFNDQTQRFCCAACEAVCHAIHDAGLEHYYLLNKRNFAPPTQPPQDLSHYDIDEVQAEFVSKMGHQRNVQLLLEGIHCAACVWLIERALGQIKGVVDARVNLSGKRLLLTWDSAQTKLSRLLAHLARIGYSAIPYRPDIADKIAKSQNRALLYRLAFAGFAMMNMFWISVALYSGASSSEFRQLFHQAGFVLATATLLYAGYPFISNAIRGLKQAYLSMDLPIAIGAITTYLYSVYVTVTPSSVGEVYYDTLVNFIFIILVGRYLEAISRERALQSTQRLVDLQARTATVKQADQSLVLPIGAVKVNDTVIVKTGEIVPVDGSVIEGSSHVNESLLSGENRPILKQSGDKISAGTVNIDNVLLVRVENTQMNTVLGRIIHRVEQAQASKAPIQCVADRIVPWFVAATLALAGISFMLWLTTDVELALIAATSVLIITCPCAFGLATPMAIASASGLAANNGILIKSGAILENLSRIDHVVFDKTGTLTEGEPQVDKIVTSDDIDANTLMTYAASLESYSNHPSAKAIRRWAESRQIKPLLDSASIIPDLRLEAGLGVSGSVNRRFVVVGSRAWLKQNTVIVNDDLYEHSERLESEGSHCIHVAFNGIHVGFIAITDKLRSDAIALVEAFRKKEIAISIVSGDRAPVVKHISDQLGGLEYRAEVLPQQKQQVIQHLRDKGLTVAMVGDGVNDAIALQTANVGIALGSGTDISAESADIVLINNQLGKIELAMQLSKRTLRTIQQNIAISLLYNLVFIPLAMLAYITPVLAAISMPISSLLVIGNAMRIRTLFNSKPNSDKKLT